ncbi:MAG: type II secretion system F family protein [Candidatus Moranbacteria bacterium]|jgi:type IV pilus assembly protein PilC|nr:type II secretion system F family protein [Candidatus Moranbacteria bacterium]MBP9801762.1 type II secretion system F family protein [Candidatus Moranbacteria bacterium]
MKFVFKAKTEAGQERSGIVEALNREAAIQVLQNNGLIPFSVQEERRDIAFVRDLSKLWEGVSQKELMVMFRQLATLISARVPMVSALNTLADQSPNRYLRIVLKEIEDDVEDGSSFSESLEKHPTVFEPLVINMLRAGEVSGTLQRAIEVVAENIEKNYQLSAKIKGALFYPGFVLAAALIIGFLVVTFILPKLSGLIRDLGVAIPWYTEVLMWIGDFMQMYWWAVLLVFFAASFSFYYYINTPAGQADWNRVVLKLPVFGNLMKYVYITRFAENMSSLLNGGIPIVKALIIVSDVTGNLVFREVILRSAEEVKTGGAMSKVFLRSPVIPPIVSQMIKIGEESGSVAKVLDGVADFYRSEVENITRNMTSLIEPILIVFLGIGVGIMVVGILMPIYDIAGKL